jgi:hypothetical protein
MEYAPKPKEIIEAKSKKVKRRKSRKRVKTDAWDASDMQSHYYDDAKSCASGFDFEPPSIHESGEIDKHFDFN